MISPNEKRVFLDRFRDLIASPTAQNKDSAEALLQAMVPRAPRTNQEKLAFQQCKVTPQQQEHFANLVKTTTREGIRDMLVAAHVPDAEKAYQSDKASGSFFQLSLLVALHQDPSNMAIFKKEPRTRIALPAAPKPAGPKPPIPPIVDGPPSTSIFDVNEYYGNLLNLPPTFHRNNLPILAEATDNTATMLTVFKHETKETKEKLTFVKFGQFTTSDEFIKRVEQILSTPRPIARFCLRNFNQAYLSKTIHDVTFGILCLACYYQWIEILVYINTVLTPENREQFINCAIKSTSFKVKEEHFIDEQFIDELIESLVPYMTHEHIEKCLRGEVTPPTKKFKVHEHYAQMMNLSSSGYNVYGPKLPLDLLPFSNVFEHEIASTQNELKKIDPQLLFSDFYNFTARMVQSDVPQLISSKLVAFLETVKEKEPDDLTYFFLLVACAKQWTAMYNKFKQVLGTHGWELGVENLIRDFSKTFKLPQSITTLEAALCYIIQQICYDDFEGFLRENAELAKTGPPPGSPPGPPHAWSVVQPLPPGTTLFNVRLTCYLNALLQLLMGLDEVVQLTQNGDNIFARLLLDFLKDESKDKKVSLEALSGYLIQQYRELYFRENENGENVQILDQDPTEIFSKDGLFADIEPFKTMLLHLVQTVLIKNCESAEEFERLLGTLSKKDEYVQFKREIEVAELSLKGNATLELTLEDGGKHHDCTLQLEPNLFFTVPTPKKEKLQSLQQYIKDVGKTDDLGVNNQFRKNTLDKTGKYVFMYLPRTTNSGARETFRAQKSSHLIDIPEELVLNEKQYILKGGLSHNGNTGEGHWTAYVRQQNGEYWLYDDNKDVVKFRNYQDYLDRSGDVTQPGEVTSDFFPEEQVRRMLNMSEEEINRQTPDGQQQIRMIKEIQTQGRDNRCAVLYMLKGSDHTNPRSSLAFLPPSGGDY